MKKGPDDYWRSRSFARKYVRRNIVGIQQNEGVKLFDVQCFLAQMQGIRGLMGGGWPRSLVDFGCGHATRAMRLRSQIAKLSGQDVRVLGVDYSEPMILEAKNIMAEIAKYDPNSEIELRSGDVYDLSDLKDNEFDVGICYGLLMSLTEPKKADLMRVVKYGLVAIEETDRAMTDAQKLAFKKVKEQTYPGRIYWHDYLDVFPGAKSIMFTPLHASSEWDMGQPPGYARIIVVKEEHDASTGLCSS